MDFSTCVQPFHLFSTSYKALLKHFLYAELSLSGRFYQIKKTWYIIFIGRSFCTKIIWQGHCILMYYMNYMNIWIQKYLPDCWFIFTWAHDGDKHNFFSCIFCFSTFWLLFLFIFIFLQYLTKQIVQII